MSKLYGFMINRDSSNTVEIKEIEVFECIYDDAINLQFIKNIVSLVDSSIKYKPILKNARLDGYVSYLSNEKKDVYRELLKRLFTFALSSDINEV